MSRVRSGCSRGSESKKWLMVVALDLWEEDRCSLQEVMAGAGRSKSLVSDVIES